MALTEKKKSFEAGDDLACPPNAKIAIRKESSISIHSVDSSEQVAFEKNGSLSPYLDPNTRYSTDVSKMGSKANLSAYDTDVEACLSTSKTNQDGTTHLIQSTSKPCNMWPGRETLKQQKKMQKLQRGCAPWHRLSSKTKLWLKILIILTVIGVAIGVGLGISRAVGGGIWKDHNPISSD